MIDGLLHPLYGQNPELMIADAVLHGLVEQNPPETVLKFIGYSLPRVVKGISSYMRRWLWFKIRNAHSVAFFGLKLA